ncbi:hypothetical protein PsorP6_011228 [Peronosclerospora sorghi]|uniref:Uncharacterized protein n=1 Tax=Peronosclerospora sorghi TaxID=230839 RepID=A0ACC0VTY9_9STRA|nr:hypothetical protein PsorP6_011228 [Peronosclerospora sorghi]
MATTTPSKCVPLDVSTHNLRDLSTLQVKLSELRLSADGTWQYLLHVTCGNGHWNVVKRYSEIRELWLELSKILGDSGAQNSCTEHIHFLAGFEQDKFPKKHLLLTQHKLEARANELDLFFLKLAMRLNLCKPHELQSCRVRGCPLQELIVGFFEVGDEKIRSRAQTDFSQSMSIGRKVPRHKLQFSTKRRSASIGGFRRRFSFGYQERSVQ